MKNELKLVITVAGIALIVWFVMQDKMDSNKPTQRGTQPCATFHKQKAKGAIWARPVVMAQAADDGNSFPAANAL